MAHISMTHKSAVLGKEQSMQIVLPDAAMQSQEPLSVLYLLHGLSDDDTCWSRYSCVEQFVRVSSLMVVMPNADRSFYTDMKMGGAYYTYIAQEVPDMIEHLFPVSSKRENRFIAGLSMGGYGALKIALSTPERFAGVASFSGVCDIERVYKEHLFDFLGVFGDTLDVEKHSLFHLAQQADRSLLKPMIYQWCGTEDFLYEDNVRFRNTMKQLHFPYTYRESAGTHSWQYWNEQLKIALELFGLCK